MNANNTLTIQSRPDRRGFWVRFRHPITGADLRIDLGTDQQNAESVCDDLSTILRLPKTLENRHDPSLDGLSQTALDAFFSEVETAEAKARTKLIELKLEILGFQIREASAFIKMIWITSDEGMKSIRRGEFDGFDFVGDPDNPRPLDRQPQSSTSYKTSYNRPERSASQSITAGKKKAPYRSHFHRDK